MPTACGAPSMRATGSSSATGCCSRSSRRGWPARTHIASCSGMRCGRGRRSGTSASSWPPTPRSRRAWGRRRSTASSTSRPPSATSTSSSSASTRSSEPRRPCMPDAVAHLGSGKVRELYALDDERLLLVASDRISTFDVVLPTEIPDKGRVLTGLAGFWFARTSSIVPNHLLALRDDGRSTECRRLEMLPIECVVRGYLAGSGWKDYRATGSVCGHRLPAGLRESERLPEPIFTPATKAQEGHDENITREQAAELVGAERLREVEDVSLRLYKTDADHPRPPGRSGRRGARPPRLRRAGRTRRQGDRPRGGGGRRRHSEGGG